MKEAIIDGLVAKSMTDIHDILSTSLGFPDYYGRNFSALWDCLSTDVERPAKIRIINSSVLEKNIGEDYKKLIIVLKKIKQYDAPLEEKITVTVE